MQFAHNNKHNQFYILCVLFIAFILSLPIQIINQVHLPPPTMDKSYKLFCSQVSGKSPKLLSQDETTILKAHSPDEQRFYQYMDSLTTTSPAYSLNQFIPNYLGVVELDELPVIEHNQKVQDEKTLEWLDHLKQRHHIRNTGSKFSILKNLVHGYEKPNVLDVKLGRKLHKNLKPKKEDFKDFFILNGGRVHLKHRQEQSNEKQEILFLTKYFFKTLKTNDEILKHLALYFFDGHQIRTQLLNKTIEKLRSIILSLKALKGWKFYSTSLCFFYDAQNDSRFDLKLLDFDRSVYSGDDSTEEASITGLENFHRLLMSVKEKSHQIEDQLCHMKFKYLNQKVLSIPDHKIQQYGVSSSRQVSETCSPRKSFCKSQTQLPE